MLTLLEQSGKKIKLYSVLAIAVTVIAIILRTCCLLWFYDEDIGYYSNSILPWVFNVFCALAVIFFASTLFTVKPEDEMSDGKEDNVALKISSAVAMLAFVFFFVFSIVSRSLVTGNTFFDLASKLSALMSIAYFAMNMFSPHTNRTAQTALGFGVIIWGVCTLGITYFDVYVQINSPDKTMLHLALLGAMAFFVGEFRCFVRNMRRKIYVFSMLCAVFLLGTASVPSLVVYLCGRASGKIYIFYNVVLFAIFVYALARLVSFAFFANEAEGEELEEEKMP